MPWDGAELWVGDLASDGWVGNLRYVAGSATESVFQPEWAPDGSLYFISDRTGWWNLYAERAGSVVQIFEVKAEIGVAQWLFGYSRYAFLSNGRIACIVDKDGFEHVVVINPPSRDTVLLPYSAFGSLRSDGAATLFFAAASETKAAEVAAFDLGNKEPRVLKRSLEMTIDAGYLSEPEPIEFPTSNGLTAFALYYAPKNKDFSAPAGERPPLLVISHGGPTSATSSALRLAVQYWTSRGFAAVA